MMIDVNKLYYHLLDSVKTEQVPGGADSQLRLARVNSSDAGNYTCAVRGARSHTVSVHVLNGTYGPRNALGCKNGLKVQEHSRNRL